MPDLKFPNLDAVPEGLREAAKQNGNEFVVSVVPSGKLAEFRDNNIELKRQVESLTGTVSALKPIIGEDIEAFRSKYSDLEATYQQVKDGKLKGTEAIAAEVANRVKASQETFEGQLREAGTKLNTTTAERDQWKSKYERSVLHQQITNAVVGKDSIANPEALPDILSRAEQLFVVQPDGTIVPKKGDTILYGADGASPMSPKEWLTKLVAEAPYLGKASAGGGANGNRNSGDTYGMPAADFAKLSPPERIKRHREAQAGKR
jgi:hypothetical protein